jgi:hypothetical protein
MPITGSRFGTFSRTALADSIRFIDVSGNGGLAPSGFDLLVNNTNPLTPSNGSYTLQIHPSGAFSNGSDSGGNIGVLKSFVRTSLNPLIYSWGSGGGASPGTINFGTHFWDGSISATLADAFPLNIKFDSADVAVQYSSPDPLDRTDFPNNLTQIPDSPTLDPSTDPPVLDPDNDDKADVKLDFTYTDTVPESPDGFAVIRDGEVVGDVINNGGPYDFTDVVPEGTYEYQILAYRYSDNSVSALSTPFTVTVGSPPDVLIIGDAISGTFDFGGSADILFIGDPSGIYTLVEGKRHDTLYDRTMVDSVDVAIPEPYGITGYLRNK